MGINISKFKCYPLTPVSLASSLLHASPTPLFRNVQIPFFHILLSLLLWELKRKKERESLSYNV